MRKTTKKFIVAVLLLSLVTMYGSMPAARAASMDSVEDTISDSTKSAPDVDHTVVFNSNDDIENGTTITYSFEAGIDLTSVTVTCPDGTSEGASADQDILCTVGGSDLSSTTDHTLLVEGAANPDTSKEYSVTVTATNVEAETEESVALIYITEAVTMSAHVDASLTFEIAKVLSGQDVNGTNTTVESSSTTIPFGDLEVDTPVIAAQNLKVTTNAGDGFTVTVQQSGDLISAGGDTIDATTTTPTAWNKGTAVLDDPTTYGSMGFTTSDASLSTGDTFGSNLYRGFSGTTPVEVMYHDGPSDGATDNIGSVNVGYQVEISGLQEAGDYTTTLTYICTPTF